MCCYRACIKKMGTQEAELFVLVLFLSKLKSTGSTLKLRQPYEGTSLQKRLRRKKKIKVYCYSPITQWKTSTAFNQSIDSFLTSFVHIIMHRPSMSTETNPRLRHAHAQLCSLVFSQLIIETHKKYLSTRFSVYYGDILHSKGSQNTA